MKRSASSALAEAIERRRGVIPRKHSVHKVEATPQEMAFEMLPDYSRLKFRRSKHVVQNLVELDADIAKVFKNATAVNKALRMLIEAVPERKPAKRKKSA